MEYEVIKSYLNHNLYLISWVNPNIKIPKQFQIISYCVEIRKITRLVPHKIIINQLFYFYFYWF